MTYPWRTALCLFACAYGALSQQPPVSLEQAIAHARDLYSRGKPAQAEALLKQAIDDSGRDPYGNPKRYEALKLLYSIVDVARPGPEAEQYLQGAINFREVTLGNLDDPRLAEDLKELAMFCGRIKDHDRGITILQRVLSIQITAGGPKSPDLVETYIRSAQLYNGKKAHENARSALRAALSVAEHNHGPEHPLLVPVLDPLASTLVLLRQYEQASEIFRRDLLIRERLFGTSSMELIATLDGLAYSYFGEKKYGEAEPVYKRLLGIWVDSAGPDHPMVAITLDKMAVFYREQERWDEGKAAADRATAIRELSLASSLSHEATFLLTRKETAAARQLYKRATTVIVCDLPECVKERESLEKLQRELEVARPERVRPGKKVN